jgi:hypothetical protein
MTYAYFVGWDPDTDEEIVLMSGNGSTKIDNNGQHYVYFPSRRSRSQ